MPYCSISATREEERSAISEGEKRREAKEKTLTLRVSTLIVTDRSLTASWTVSHRVFLAPYLVIRSNSLLLISFALSSIPLCLLSLISWMAVAITQDEKRSLACPSITKDQSVSQPNLVIDPNEIKLACEFVAELLHGVEIL
jgi:hypothetical protein